MHEPPTSPPPADITSAARELIALLAREGRAVEIEHAAHALKVNPAEFSRVAQEAQRLAQQAGLLVCVGEKSVALAAPTEPREETLSPAARETLAAICYLAPVSKEALDELRGVNCGVIVNMLLRAGLIERQEINGAPHYTPSATTLAALGVSRVQELPEYARCRAELREALGYPEEPQEV